MFRYRLALPALFAAALVAAAPIPTDGTFTLGPGSRLWVDGTSTVRSFSCEATAFDAQIQGDTPVGGVLSGVKAITSVDITVPVKSLDCKNGKMNEHMLKALKANEHTEIAFALTSYELAPVGETMRATLTGSLTMGGVEKPITIDADVFTGEGGALKVTGAVDVNMKEFGLKPPSLMLGTMKVREVVNVKFELFIQQ